MPARTHTLPRGCREIGAPGGGWACRGATAGCCGRRWTGGGAAGGAVVGGGGGDVGQGGRGAGGRHTREWVQGTSAASALRVSVVTDGALATGSFREGIGYWQHNVSMVSVRCRTRGGSRSELGLSGPCSALALQYAVVLPVAGKNASCMFAFCNHPRVCGGVRV